MSHIFQFASIHGEDAAIQRLNVLRYPKTSEALSGADGCCEPARKKILKPVEYKGNFIGGKKAIKDLIFERARGSRALQNATTLSYTSSSTQRGRASETSIKRTTTGMAKRK
jgi:hypothetical protein